MPKETKDGVSFATEAAAGASDELVYAVDRPATVEHVTARIYSGAETTLELVPVVRTVDENERPLVELVGKPAIDGDDDSYEWNISQEIEKNEEIVIKYTNTDGSNAHNFRVNVDIDHLGGVERAESIARRLLGRVM